MSGTRGQPLGFWESLAQRARVWALRHPAMMHRLRLAWLIWILGSFVVFLVGRAVVPQWRHGVGAWLWSYVALVILFLVARTKTVSWRLVAMAFGAGCLFAPLIALADVVVSGWLDADINGHDGSVLVAGPVEESLKLLPLVGFLVVARRRARGLAVVDFILLGYALGLGFGAVEDTVRRVVAAAAEADSPLGLPGGLITLGVPEDDLGQTQWGVSWLPGWSRLFIPSFKEEVFFGGHAVTTGIAAAGLGFGLRLRRRLGVAALVIPVALFGWMVFDHAMYNHTVNEPVIDIPRPEIDPDLLPEGMAQELDPHTVEPPEWVLRIYRGLGKGAAERPLLTGLLVVGLVLDVRQVRRAGRAIPHLPDLRVPSGIRDRGDAFAASLRGAVGTRTPHLVRGGFALVAESVRGILHVIADSIHDVALTVLALGDDPRMAWTFDYRTQTWTHPQQGWARFDARAGQWIITAPSGAVTTSPYPPGQADGGAPTKQRSRRKRLLVAMTYLRARRQSAHLLAHRARKAGPRQGALGGVVWTVMIIGTAAAVIYGLSVLHGVDPITPLDQPGIFGEDGFLANLLEDLADWWDSLSFAEQTLIVLTITGLLTWGFAPMLGLGWGFWPTLGIVSEFTVIPEYGHGLADFTRDPRAATASYVENLTWQQAALDAFTVGTEVGSHGAAPNPGSAWRRQIDEMADGADDAARRQADEAVPHPNRARVELPPNPRLDAEEIDSMHRLAEAPEMAGETLRQHPDDAFDYIDSRGRDIDQIGKRGASLHWEEQRANFFQQLDMHIRSSDITVVDVTHFSAEQVAEIRTYLDALPAADQAKTIRIGF